MDEAAADGSPEAGAAVALEERRLDQAEAVEGPASGPRHARPGARRPGRTLLVYGGVGLSYLALAVGVWWHVWSSHPTSTFTCGCGDPALFMWFLEWPAYALTHGHSPLYSTALFHPGGINLLSNTSVLGIGIPLIPVTLLFGPVATLNVASTLAPALSALACFWVLRRWVTWTPAAWLGGLLYGFSPFVLTSLVAGHLMTAMLVIPPLFLGCLDELLIRQHHRPLRVGLVAGLLMVVEFFLSTELVVVMGLALLVALVVLVAYALVGHRAELAARAPGAVRGLVAGGLLAGVLLAYPTWFALAGPAHLSSPIWPYVRLGGYTLHAFVATAVVSNNSFLEISGYFGPVGQAALIGWGALAVIVGGMVVWRRDRRLWFFAAVGLLTAWLSLTVLEAGPVPWKVLWRLPVLSDVIEQRFTVVTDLAAVVLLAIVLDRVRAARLPRRLRLAPRLSSALSAAAAVVLAAVAVVPVLVDVAPTVPFNAETVVQPTWFAEVAPHLSERQVLLVSPPPFSGVQSALAWQALASMSFDQAGGGGPQGTLARAGHQQAGFAALSSLGLIPTPEATGSPAQFAAVRRALDAWGVTMVVVPVLPPGYRVFVTGNPPQYPVAYLTAALGRPPRFEADAWVWSDVDASAAPPYVVPPGTLGRCAALATRHPARRLLGPACVVQAGTSP